MQSFKISSYHSSCQKVLKQYASAISCRPHTMWRFSASHLYVICVPSRLARISSSPCGSTISHPRDLRYRHISMMSTSFISPRHSVCSLPFRSIRCMSCCVSFLLVAITPRYTTRTCRSKSSVCKSLIKRRLSKMPRPRKSLVSWGFGVPCRTRTCFSALCYAA